ncbi:hypothetical protein AgCh_024758 [Apium graveolens]
MSDEEKDLFSKLPDGFREKFTQQILSRTTPEDVVRMSVVSKSFLACANSDVVWDTFIPPHHTKRLLERFRNYSLDSSREVYFFLCTYADEDRRNPVLGVFLDKWSGKMCVNITHEKLAITQLETDYWKKREESTKENIYLDPRIANSKCNHHCPNIKLRDRDSYFEVKLGEYFNKNGEKRDVEITLKEVDSGRPKCGVHIVGMEMRPKRKIIL